MVLDNVIPLRPDTYAVSVDVSVALPLIHASIWLNFGPFDSRSEAEEWLSVLQDVHRLLEEPKAHGRSLFSSATTVSEEEFTVNCFIGDTDTPKVGASFREKGALIPPGSPTDTAEELCLYALRALAESIGLVLAHFP